MILLKDLVVRDNLQGGECRFVRLRHATKISKIADYLKTQPTKTPFGNYGSTKHNWFDFLANTRIVQATD